MLARAAYVLLGLAGVVAGACGSESHASITDPVPPPLATVRLPRAPGVLAPSLVVIDAGSATARGSDDISTGTMLADVDSCSSCHPDAAAQWASSAHSFASFGNPIYRKSVLDARAALGNHASQHCGGCHDMPLAVDGLLASKDPAAIAPDDLRAHSGVTCRLCHGIEKVSKDGNGSYVWSPAPIEAPDLHDAASIARHRAQVSVKALGTELCVGCHRGFLSPDMEGMPVHLTGLDEPGAWRSSAWNGNGIARVDRVDKQTCIDCHMAREAATAGEYGAKAGTIASHRFLGGHTWMAGMRGDADTLARLQAKLAGVASIDIAGALAEAPGTRAPIWTLPADAAAVVPGRRIALDVVVRNLLVGHRFPGGVLDIDDTWIEVEVRTRDGKLLASSGQGHEHDPHDEDAHALRTLVVDEHGEVLERHEMAAMRTQIATQTLAPREAQVVRYALDVPADLPASALPLTVTARLRHRTRTLAMQLAVCAEARTPAGGAFLHGAKGTRGVDLDPCRPQPITEIASTRVELGTGARAADPTTAWQRDYEHGMALVSTVSERLEEARSVLTDALAIAPDDRARAMVVVQLAEVAAKQGRADDAIALVAQARTLLGPTARPPVLDAVAAEALARVWRWDDAIAPARACAEAAPQSQAAWVVLARVLGSVGDDRDALAAASTGLELAPRDPDLLRGQAVALAALHRPEADAALAAYDRFRSPDNSAELRIECAGEHSRCAREREQGHTHVLHVTR
jgi:tetratricopeptide (TPR) repeat protein